MAIKQKINMPMAYAERKCRRISTCVVFIDVEQPYNSVNRQKLYKEFKLKNLLKLASTGLFQTSVELDSPWKALE